MKNMLLSCFCFVMNVLFLKVQGNPDKKIIDIDYYGRGFMRHTRVSLDCNLVLHRQYCRFKCSRSHAVCIEGNCYCIKGDMSGLLPNKELNQPEDLPSESSEEVLQPLNAETLDTRPILRHHIAHFCPDLELARQCIRKCQQEGKPAFCGKDHNCYCGHKYNNWKKNEKIDVISMYAQFKDLYDKYFGRPTETPRKPKPKPHIPNDNADDTIKDNDIVVAQSAENKPTDGDNNADAAAETTTEAAVEPDAGDENKPEATTIVNEESRLELKRKKLRKGDAIQNLLKAVLRQGLDDEYDD